MSMTEPVETLAEPWDGLDASPSSCAACRRSADRAKNSIAGHSLTVVVAIMTFLGSLTAGSAMLVVSAASDWQSEVGREVTIQVRPAPGRDIEADVRAGPTSRAPPRHRRRARLYQGGIRAAGRAMARQPVSALDDLPIPRLIVVKLASGARPDFTSLRNSLAAQVPSSSLDDHRRWIDRMRTMAGTAVVGVRRGLCWCCR